MPIYHAYLPQVPSPGVFVSCVPPLVVVFTAVGSVTPFSNYLFILLPRLIGITPVVGVVY